MIFVAVQMMRIRLRQKLPLRCICLLKANSHRHTRKDETAAPASRPPPRRRPGRQLRPAALLPIRSDIVRHENVATLQTAVCDYT